MKRSNRKGFTIVELVIVIAVVAILTAVLIPTFGGIIEKANASADEQTVYQMTTALEIEGNPENLDAALEALEKNGIKLEALIPLSAGYSYVWNDQTKKIEFVKTSETTLKPIGVAVKSAADLAAAFNNGAKYVKLDSNITVGQSITISGADGTLDLNGKTIAVNTGAKVRPITIAEGSEVVITNGNIVNTFAGTYGVCDNYGTLTLNNINFSEGEGDNGAAFKNNTGGKMYVNGGSYSITHANGNQVFRNHQDCTDNYLEINSATITSSSTTNYPLFVRSGEAKINGGSIYGTMGAINLNAGKLTIDGGEFVNTNANAGDYYAIYVNNAFGDSVLEVLSGTFTGKNYDVFIGDDDGLGGEVIDNYTISVTINAGVVLAKGNLHVRNGGEQGNVTVTDKR